MTTKNPQEELDKIKTLEDFQAWISHPYTEKVFKALEEEQKLLAHQAAFFAAKNPIQNDAVMINLHGMDTVRRIVEKLRRPLVNLIIIPQTSTTNISE
jgi:hypothetical protein